MKRILITIGFILTVLINTSYGQGVVRGDGKTVIKGLIEGYAFKPNSKVVFKVYKSSVISTLSEYDEIYSCPLTKAGQFEVNINAQEEWFYIKFAILNGGETQGNPLTGTLFSKLYLFENGDDIHLNVNIAREKVAFKGKGADKLRCQYNIRRIQLPVKMLQRGEDLYFEKKYSEEMQFEGKMQDVLQNFKLEVLKSYAGVIPDKIYKQLYVNTLSEIQYDYLRDLYILLSGSLPGKKAAIDKYYREIYNKPELIHADDNVLQHSPWYTDYLFEKERVAQIAPVWARDRTLAYSVKAIYEQIKQKYSGVVRDRVIITCFKDLLRNNSAEVLSLAENAKELIQDARYKVVFADWEKNHSYGAKAFNFSLQDTSSRLHTLDEFKGKVIVMDFWYNGCHGCTQIPPLMKIMIEKFKQKPEVVFVSVNIDRSRERWMVGLKRGIYTVEGELHLNTGSLGQDNPLLKFYNYWIFPQLLIIGKEGELISSNPPDPRDDQGKGMMKLIEQAL